ncbi:restriction endonuclease subunit S [Pseudocitrobacter corydidari]|uniref:Type I restriction modification DNA specificity domain-containing protein n=1 Tax=Pseudocitrobacter corydidari TaxID=2891570 RepID=A0ABY3S8Y7_9ENTR|nr:restriction endonuclease subunit S [Pseudocitrobacter corydidari]UGS42263.1 hypothetical protein G163CM_29910 [Pseudocitrobacter corydidari]
MGSDWKSIVLNDLINQGHAFLQTGPFGTALKAEEYTDNGVPLISVREIRNGYIKIEGTTPRVSRNTTNRLPKFVLNKGDIVFARKGGVDRTAYITEKEAGWFLGSDGIYLRLDDNYNSLFISYIMRSPTTREWLIKNSEGTTMPSLNQKILSRIPLTIPDLCKQNIIANFLYSLDKKININNQLNHTLEQMSKTLFKSWFVDFDPVIDNALDAGNPIPEALQSRVELRQKVRNSADFKPLPAEIRSLFPGEFEETELGWVPKGWTISNLGKEFNITMGQSPSGITYNESRTGLPFFQGKTDFGFRFPSERIYCTDPKRLAYKLDTLLSVRAPVGVTNLASTECIIGRGLAALRHKSGNIAFTYYSISNLSDYFSVFNGEGTVFGSINQKDLKQLPLLCSPTELINKFEELSGKWEEKIFVHCGEIENLSKLRDTLLPKLISGELSVEDLPDLIKQTEAA